MLRKEARIRGQINRLAQAVKRHEGLASYHEIWSSYHSAALGNGRREISELLVLLDAMRKAIALHKTWVNLDAEPSVRPHRNKRLGRRGDMTRIIFCALAEAGDVGLVTSQIANAVIDALAPNAIPMERERYRLRVLVRLTIMANSGRITKAASPKFSREHRWYLASL